MITFKPLNHPIGASRKRIVSLWFADVDRLQLLNNTEKFTGSAILATVLTLAGVYQYYVVFQSLSQHTAEIWAVSPDNVRVTDAPAFEKELLETLNMRGISLEPLFADSANYAVILSHLPVAYDDENETAPVGLFAVSQMTKTTASLDNEDKNALKQLLRKA